MTQKKSSPWKFIFIGCGLVVLAAIVVAGGCTFLAVRFGQEVAEMETNPDARTEKALELLDTDRLPDGYFAQFALSIPFIGDVLLLGDEPPLQSGRAGKFDQRGFIYINMRNFGNDDDLERFFEGDGDLRDAFGRVRSRGNIDLDFRRARVLKRGRLEGDDYTAPYALIEGALEIHDRDLEGLMNLLWVRCNDDDRMRLAIWLGPRPESSEEAESSEAAAAAGDASEAEVDYTGTPGDPDLLRQFVSNFHFCGR